MVRVGFKLTAESELRHLPNVLRDIGFLHGPGAIAAGFPKTYKTDVYLFPRQLDEQVRTLHRPALGAALTVFAQEFGNALAGEFMMVLLLVSIGCGADSPNSSLIELVRSIRGLCGLLRTRVDWHCQSKMD